MQTKLTVVLILIVVEDGLVLLKQDVNEVIVEGVLILIVVEDGLVHIEQTERSAGEQYVLILIVVEDGLVHIRHTAMSARQIGLNPYCSGRWSRTVWCL